MLTDTETMVRTCTPTSPLIIFMDKSHDPLNDLQVMLGKMQMQDKLIVLQVHLHLDANKIKEQLKSSTRTGEWVCFSGCHVNQSIFFIIDEFLEYLDPSQAKSSFKIIFLTNILDLIPISLYNKSQKFKYIKELSLK